MYIAATIAIPTKDFTKLWPKSFFYVGRSLQSFFNWNQRTDKESLHIRYLFSTGREKCEINGPNAHLIDFQKCVYSYWQQWKMDNLHLSVKFKVCVWFLNIRSIPLFKVLWQDHVTVLPHCVHTSLLADCANLWQCPQTYFLSIYTTNSCRQIYKTQTFSGNLLFATMPPESSIKKQDNKEAYNVYTSG
jgi:hypothetical protein